MDPGKTSNLPLPLQTQLKNDTNWVRTGVYGDGSCFFHSLATATGRCRPKDKECGHQFRLQSLDGILTLENWTDFWTRKNIDPIPSFDKAERTLPLLNGRKAWAYDALIVFCLEKLGYNYIFLDSTTSKPFCGVFAEDLHERPTVVILWVDRSHFEPVGYRENGTITYIFSHDHPKIMELRNNYHDSCSGVSLEDLLVAGQKNVKRILYFYKSSCPFCQAFDPVFDKIALKKTNVEMVRKNSTTEMMQLYKFKTVPTIVRIFSDGSFDKLAEEDRSEESFERFVEGETSAMAYTYSFDDTVSSSDRNMVRQSLSNMKGWSGLGYSFNEIPEKQNADVKYFMIPNEQIVQMFTDQFHGFSVCVTTASGRCKVYFNQKNWNDPPESFTGTLQEYRDYVVQHETGHALGFPHVEQKKNQLCHPMYQQTKGTQHCTPNPWITLIV